MSTAAEAAAAAARVRDNDGDDFDDADSELELEQLAALQAHATHGAGEEGQSRYVYESACQELGILPSSVIMSILNKPVLNLKHHGLKPPMARALGAALAENATVREIDLADNWIQPQGAEYLCKSLSTNEHITRLDLSTNRLGNLGAGSVAILLNRSHSLRWLSLRSNKFMDLAAQELSEALVDNRSLTFLDLSHNEFTSRAGSAFATVIQSNISLRHLDLSWNKIRGDAGKALCGALADNVALETLNLERNGLDGATGVAVGAALMQNTSLRELNLSHNRVSGEAAAKSIAQMLEANSTIERLGLAWNPFSPTDGTLIAVSLCRAGVVRQVDLEKVDVLWHQVPEIPVWINENNSLGHYELNLSKQSDRIVAARLLKLRVTETNVTWRNVTLNGAPLDLPPFLNHWRLPDSGVLKLDHVYATSHVRLRGVQPVPEESFRDVLLAQLKGMREFVPKVSEAEAAAAAAAAAAAPAPAGRAPARPAAAPAAAAAAAAAEGEGSGDGLPLPVTNKKRVEMVAYYCKEQVHFSTEQVLAMLATLDGENTHDRVDLIAAAYPGVVDKGFFHPVLATLAPEDQALLEKRLGTLT